ncbi:MAG: 8-oxo-dGTP pyrophosphatase MutT (NUDIX family) [Halioglobus sp.]|jgi:8-oxo-dGTP pyrophosphatase MutT (NUDIX family)
MPVRQRAYKVLNIAKRLQEHLPLAQLPWRGSGLQAGVLVAITDEREPNVILGRRAAHLRLHPGEIAFPGGKREVEDATPWATALREAHEEIGLQPELVTPLGELPPLYTRTHFQVHPCVALVPETFDRVVDPEELDSVFFTPLATLASGRHYHLEKMQDNGVTRWVPHYQINGDNIWGVTAQILVQVVNLALGANLELDPTNGVAI